MVPHENIVAVTSGEVGAMLGLDLPVRLHQAIEAVAGFAPIDAVWAGEHTDAAGDDRAATRAGRLPSRVMAQAGLCPKATRTH